MSDYMVVWERNRAVFGETNCAPVVKGGQRERRKEGERGVFRPVLVEKMEQMGFLAGGVLGIKKENVGK